MKIYFYICFVLFFLLPNSSFANELAIVEGSSFFDDEYENFKKQADDFFKQGEYKKAQLKYMACLSIPNRRNDVYAKSKVEQCNQAIELRRQADEYIAKNQPNFAKETYEKLVNLNATDEVGRKYLASYWENEANRLFTSKLYASSKQYYEKALQFSNVSALLQQKVAECEKQIKIENDLIAVKKQQVEQRKPVENITQPTKQIQNIQKKHASPLKIILPVIGLGSGAYATLLNIQWNNKINAIANAKDAFSFYEAYDNAYSFQSKKTIKNIALGVAIGAALGEAYLLLKPSKKTHKLSLKPSDNSWGIAAKYKF